MGFSISVFSEGIMRKHNVLVQASLKQLSLLPLIVDIVLVLHPTHLNNYNDHKKKNKAMTKIFPWIIRFISSGSISVEFESFRLNNG